MTNDQESNFYAFFALVMSNIQFSHNTTIKFHVSRAEHFLCDRFNCIRIKENYFIAFLSHATRENAKKKLEKKNFHNEIVLWLRIFLFFHTFPTVSYSSAFPECLNSS